MQQKGLIMCCVRTQKKKFFFKQRKAAQYHVTCTCMSIMVSGHPVICHVYVLLVGFVLASTIYLGQAPPETSVTFFHKLYIILTCLLSSMFRFIPSLFVIWHSAAFQHNMIQFFRPCWLNNSDREHILAINLLFWCFAL